MSVVLAVKEAELTVAVSTLGIGLALALLVLAGTVAVTVSFGLADSQIESFFRGFHTLTEIENLRDSGVDWIKILFVHFADPRLGDSAGNNIRELVIGQFLRWWSSRCSWWTMSAMPRLNSESATPLRSSRTRVKA